MEAPKEIWLLPDIEMPDGLSILWYEAPYRTGAIKYFRTDAFIKKACDAYCKVCGHYPHTVPTYICRKNCDYFSDFKKYMEE